MPNPIIALFSLGLVLTVPSHPAGAQANRTGADHSAMHDGASAEEPRAPAQLQEPGQDAFAALSEVVAVLESNPETDWARVDIDALRDHLMDMDRIITEATARTDDLPDGLRTNVTGTGETVGTIQRMIPSHAEQLAADKRWTVMTKPTADGAELTVTSDDPATMARIKALGFYGLMVSQDHHREHHFDIATGQMVH